MSVRDMTTVDRLARAFSALEPHELIRVRAHTEAWGVISPAGPLYEKGQG